MKLKNDEFDFRWTEAYYRCRRNHDAIINKLSEYINNKEVVWNLIQEAFNEFSAFVKTKEYEDIIISNNLKRI